jgi:hypothetical protein
MSQPKVCEEFISKEDAAKLNEYLRSKSIMNPHNLLNVSLTPLHLDKYSDGLEFHVIVESIIKRVGDQFGIDNIDISRAMYQVLQKNDSLGYHTDAYGGVEGYTEEYYSALVYLTDDYQGGEILFYNGLTEDKNNAVAYKPDAGTLIYFKGDKNTPHSVNEVISGERSNIILFYKEIK